MVNSPAPGTRPFAGSTPQPGECPPDCDLPENSPENLDARLDHGVEETFPASDPVSVMVTKKAVAPEPQEAPAAPSGSPRQEIRNAAEGFIEQAKETLRGMTEHAPDTVRAAYGRGRHSVVENPWPALLIASAIGFGLAWLIHGRPHDDGVPNYARTRRGYAPHRDE